MKLSKCLIWLLVLFTSGSTLGQGLVNTSASPHAKMYSVGLGDVKWTSGFWGERMEVCKNVMVPQLWKTYNDAQLCHSFKNFEIAAGLDTGRFRGPSFHDGDFYKTLEAMAALYAQTKDSWIDREMDRAIAVIAKAQKDGGYIYTKSIIEQQKSGQTKMFDDKLSFEAYNFGHLMTAACVHFRATGKRSLLNVAIRATDFLLNFYTQASPEQARNAICPSHYMGIIEMYRTTQDARYLNLVKKLIDIRGLVDGTDDNSDRYPFRAMQRIAGHAVRANYLMAGVADFYVESGDESLKQSLDLLWEDVILKKMYVTGGCGALFDGVSVDGTSYKPDSVQKVHQSYGRDYQLPNLTAHNETCANIGNVLWNWRMFLMTGEARYMDIVELALYNSVLSGVSLDGSSYFYTNPLAADRNYPYHLRWEGGRKPYIKLSNCCPPNLVRTVAEVSSYQYTLSEKSLFVNLFGGSMLKTKTANGDLIEVQQETNYPWNGKVKLKLVKWPASSYALQIRIPGWCEKASFTLNDKPLNVKSLQGTYIKLPQSLKAGDVVELNMSMPVSLIESNPLVEETRNQVAVKRGPMVYCLESPDLPKGSAVNALSLIAGTSWVTKPTGKNGAFYLQLHGQAKQTAQMNWNKQLYRPWQQTTQTIPITLIPYYAWANRGSSDMRVWLPLAH